MADRDFVNNGPRGGFRCVFMKDISNPILKFGKARVAPSLNVLMFKHKQKKVIA